MSTTDATQVDAPMTLPTEETGQVPAAEVPMVHVDNIRKSFGTREVLKGIDLVIPKGSVCVVLGGSGMGKSVLMKHLIGLLTPTSGRVLIEGQDLAELGAVEMKSFRRKFGMVFQQAALFDSMTNYDNVAFPLREHARLSPKDLDVEVRKLLDLFSLDPDIVGPRFPSEISGGQRKRVGLARAVALKPSLVLYDEPTTGLDPITTDQVDEMILDAKRKLGVTSVVISHDIASAFNIADQILFIFEGQIIARGTKDDMLGCEHPFARKFFATWSEKNG